MKEPQLYGLNNVTSFAQRLNIWRTNNSNRVHEYIEKDHKLRQYLRCFNSTLLFFPLLLSVNLKN